MTSAHASPSPLEALFDAWARSDRALSNLLRAMPPEALGARALPTSPTVGAMCMHLHHERMVSVLENAPECAGPMPEREWIEERDVGRITALLAESARCVRDAVSRRIAEGRQLDKDFAHPMQLITFLIFHDAYHHGQIKLALKACGHVLPDEVVGEQVWDVWRGRGAS